MIIRCGMCPPSKPVMSNTNKHLSIFDCTAYLNNSFTREGWTFRFRYSIPLNDPVVFCAISLLNRFYNYILTCEHGESHRMLGIAPIVMPTHLPLYMPSHDHFDSQSSSHSASISTLCTAPRIPAICPLSMFAIS